MPANILDFQPVFGNLVSALLTLVGAGFVVMLVIGGFNYLQAGDNKEAASRAWHTLTFAFFGLVLAASAWMIIAIFGNFLGIPDIGIFNLCAAPGC